MPTLSLGPSTVQLAPHEGLGLVIAGPAAGTPDAYLDAVFDDANAREAFFQLVERELLVVCRGLEIDPAPYRHVGGKRTHGRLSQGEYFHHDGCSTPEKPRINEIRCPQQRVVRTMLTTIAPFPAVVEAMVRELPDSLRRTEEIARWHGQIEAGTLPDADWDVVQGRVNSIIRALPSETARAYFRSVDEHLGAFAEPWTLGESRFIANGRTPSAQHRRACYPPWTPGIPNGHLLKRWPAEELPPPRSHGTRQIVTMPVGKDLQRL